MSATIPRCKYCKHPRIEITCNKCSGPEGVYWKQKLHAMKHDPNFYVSYPDPCFDMVTAILHIGFLSVEETEEQLARLPEGKKEIDHNKPKRSRISKTNEIIRPINSTASKVLPHS